MSAEAPVSDVLVVDDHEPNLMLYAKILSKIEGVKPRCFLEPRVALAWAETKVPVLAIVDQMMPAITGLEFTERLRGIPGREGVPFLMVTANEERELRREALRRGALGFMNKPVDPVEFLSLATNVLRTDRRRRDAVTRADEHGARVRTVEEQLATRDAMLVDALFAALRLRDPQLGEHGERVAALTARLAKRLGIPAAERTLLEHAARVHDIGKLAFPDRILHGTPRLDAAGVALVREHAPLARSLIPESEGELLRIALVVATMHHERWDGAGYPGGLRADAIPLNARIVAVADAYCALTAVRPTRPAMSPGHALSTIEAQRNTAYDPRIVVALRETVSEAPV